MKVEPNNIEETKKRVKELMDLVKKIYETHLNLENIRKC